MRENPTDSEQMDRRFEPTSPFTLPGFFSKLRDGDLVAGVCRRCSTHLVPPRLYCFACGSGQIDLEVQPLSGVVHSFTEVRRPPSGFEGPYMIGIVELDSGARLTGRIVADYDEVRIGMRVTVMFEDSPMSEEGIVPDESGWPIPVFRLE